MVKFLSKEKHTKRLHIMSRNKLIHHLSELLADTYILTLKTQNYHWNVTGAHFSAYHSFLESQYEDLFKAADSIAERIRALNSPAPGSYAVFSKLASLKEETEVPKASQMIKNLAKDHEKIIANISKILKVAQTEKDEGTADFLIERLRDHEKTLWMLKSCD